ncbi:flavodoxin domain-containing protein [Blastococcus tunisiensis]|uniref:Menaquinone-dependent protoporphyrinogen oxidase n=1 Tax=Blastococcus tunisiensis TaxID=1798228 RepID=A0A1I2L1S7_9ACTN|nr:flavodoxin domain-containing protein [Blastococcus sp. DSM 46838]SFF72793.1 menaquinone-dependent protoporphyrinogen oxidase [Blastococcus sp. DSM 46838]
MSVAEPSPGTLRVLVVVASKHGATRGIAEVLTDALTASGAGQRAGLTAALYDAAHAPAPAHVDAVVIGSAVYAGRWREEARDYVTAHAAQLRTTPVWLFSSGPIGAPPFPPDEPHDVHPLGQLVGARGHRVFPGRLDMELLSIGERAMVTAMRAPLGDFRDPEAVRAWAGKLAQELVGDRAARA